MPASPEQQESNFIKPITKAAKLLDISPSHDLNALLSKPLKEIDACRELSLQILQLFEMSQDREVHSVENEKDLFSWYCDKAQLELPKDFFNHLGHHEIVEIFDLEGKSIYKNLFYFQFSGYTLEEHATMTFFELFSRPGDIDEKIVEFLTDIIGNEDYSLRANPVETHRLKERYTKEKSIFEIDVQCAQLVRCSLDNSPKAVAVRTKVKEYDLNKLN